MDNRTGIGKEAIARDLQEIGVEEGDCLALGVSLRQVGWIKGGPKAFVEALLDTLGEDGTVFIPAFTRLFPLPLSRTKKGSGLRQRWGGLVPWEYIFDPLTTPPTTGAVPTTMWKWPGSTRSRHPSNSVVAIGGLAAELTQGHDENSQPFLPYERLGELGGKGLFIGLGGRLVSLRHQAQYEAGLMQILPPRAGVRYLRSDGSIGLYVRKEFACVTRLPELNTALQEVGLMKAGKVGAADSVIVDAAGTISALAEMLRSDPSLNLCEDIMCLWCRELERSLDLYPRIERPAIYQRSLFLRRMVAGFNDQRKGNSIWAERAFKVAARLVEMAEG